MDIRIPDGGGSHDSEIKPVKRIERIDQTNPEKPKDENAPVNISDEARRRHEEDPMGEAGEQNENE